MTSTWRLARPARIAAALAQSQAQDSGGWFVAGTSSDVGSDASIARTIAGREVTFWRTSDGSLVAGPGACPHLGALLEDCPVLGGTMYCRWHGLAFTPDGDRTWSPYRAYDDGVLIWVGLPTAGESPSDRPNLPPRPPLPASVTAVIHQPGTCEPQDVIANRLDPWHGAGFHPYSFTHLDVLTYHPSTTSSPRTPIVFLVAVTFRIGRLRIPVVAEFTSPEPRTIVVRIVDGEGTGSVVETHATPVDPGADRRPRTAVLEAVIAHSDRTGFVQARKAGARPGVLADAVLLPQLVPEISPRADPVSRPRRTRRGRPTPQSRWLRPSVSTPRWLRPPANAPPTTTPVQLHQPARRPGHHLRQPCSGRPRRASVHHDHHAHPTSAVGLLGVSRRHGLA